MKKALQYILPICLSALLVWYMFRKVDFRQTVEILSHGVDYWWILAAMVLSIFSHIFRAMRWRIQLHALHVKASLMELSCAVFGCYAINLLLPRAGELWRCTFVAKRARARFTTVMGSMMADRLADVIMLMIITLFTFIVAAPALAAFMARYPVGEKALRIAYSPVAWVVILLSAGIAFLLLRRYWETASVARLRRWVAEIWRGFAVSLTMPGRGRFILLSIAIWSCYFIQLYVAFFAFGFTRELCSRPGLAFGLLPCLVAFVLSSIGMAVPSNGGLGPWNIAIMFGLAVYGIEDVEGAAFSILQWSGQTVMLILLGIFTTVWVVATSGRHRINNME